MIGAVDRPTSGKIFLDGRKVISAQDRKLRASNRELHGAVFEIRFYQNVV